MVLVRHAEKEAEPASDPGLTIRGTQRAEQLAHALAHTRVGHVITSQYRRTRETGAPTADRLSASTEVIPAGLSEDALGAVVEAVAARPPGEGVLVVGHSNTIPRLVAAFGGAKFDDLSEDDYDSIFVLIIHGSGTVDTLKLNFLIDAI